MAEDSANVMSLLPDEMLKFILYSSHHLLQTPRLGQLLTQGRPPIQTPHFVAATSRGVVPHLSHDVLGKHTDISAVYIGLEDFIEKSCHNAPILKIPTKTDESTLRKFTALPNQCLSMLGPRRIPRVTTSTQNSDSTVSICTSVGFRTLELSEYVEATASLRPDVSTALADLPAGEKLSKRRIEKMADRTQAWLKYTVSADAQRISSLFASIPPIDVEQQQLYLSDLCSAYLESLSGLSIHDTSSALVIRQQLSELPILCITDPPTPQAVLQAMALGVDLITVPFVTAASEQGIAFTFAFPPSTSTPSEASETQPAPSALPKQPLGIDLFSPTHATSLAPLYPYSPSSSSQSCTCYTCTRHHRAYIHHLLSAREMLAWTLLQIHNFRVLNHFFAGVRTSIRNGTFEQDKESFEKFYLEDFGLDHQTTSDPNASASANDNDNNINAGPLAHTNVAAASIPAIRTAPPERGPRLRGYQSKSLGKHLDKPREKIWGRFEHERPQKTKAKATANTNDSGLTRSLEGSTGSGTPAEVSLGEENDQVSKIEEAKEAGAQEQAEIEFTASDFEMLRLAEKEDDVKH